MARHQNADGSWTASVGFKLNQYYKLNLLRYASSFDICIQPSSIPCDRVLKKALAVVRLCERKIEPAII